MPNGEGHILVINCANIFLEKQIDFSDATTLTSYNMVDIQQLVDKFGSKLAF
jgi:hypothetical protein